MTDEQKEFVSTRFEPKRGSESSVFFAWFDEQMRVAIEKERQRCVAIAQAQADSISSELPDGLGGSWAKRFGKNVALSIAGAISRKATNDRLLPCSQAE